MPQYRRFQSSALPDRSRATLALLLGVLAALIRPSARADSAVAAPAVPPITSAADIYSLPPDAAHSRLPAKIEITANYYDPYWKLLWGTDRGGDSYFTLASVSPRIKSGQRFIVSGPIVPADGLPLATATLTLLPDPPPPLPLSTRGHVEETDRFNGHVVTVEGYVNRQTEIDANHLGLDLAVEGHAITARVLIADNSPIPQVEGALVRVTGVYVSDNSAKSVHVNLWVPRPENVEVTGWLDHDSRFAIPVSPIDRLMRGVTTEFTRVIGTVQSQQPGESIVLHDDSGQITLLTAMDLRVHPGETVEAIGWPAQNGLNTVLRESLYRPISATAAPPMASRGLPLLRLADQVRRLSLEEAAHGYAARLWAVVTWSNPDTPFIYVLDASGGIQVKLPPALTTPPSIGVRLDIAGHSIAGAFAPAVQADKMVIGGSLPVPAPNPISLEQAMRGIEEGQWVSISGYARTVRSKDAWTKLTIATSAGDFVAVVPRSERAVALEGSVLDARGICVALTDADHELTGIELQVPSDEDLVVDEPKPANPFDEPLRSIASLHRFSTLDAFNHRVRLSGVVLYQEPGVYLNLQEEGQSLMVLSRDSAAMQPGDQVDVVGFPGREGPRLILRESVYRRTGHVAEPPAVLIETPEALHPALDGRLVTVEATVADIGHQASNLSLVCQARGGVFEAKYNRPEEPLPADLAPGSRVALTGVYVIQTDQNGTPRSFQLRLRTARDLVQIAPPPWWTATRTKSIVGGLALAILLGLAWVVALRRRVQSQTTEIRDQLQKSARLEAELARSSKLESLGVLAGGIAHDFNNLLTVVIGNLSLVIGDRRVTAEDEGFLRESERAALRARDLTQQLLTFAKGGAPIRSAVLLPDIVREAAGFALHGSKVRCDFDLSPGLWPAHVDRGQIGQVVHNIVINALHAMPTGGIVRITLRNAEIAPGAPVPLAPGRFLKLSLRDSGSGISPDYLPRIFDPYFTTKQQGSGLGLATVYSIVKKHAGHIDVESRLGFGTTFHIWLPAATTSPVTAPALPATVPRLTGRALLMDDEAPVRDLAAAMLRRLGLDVTAVADGAALIDAYRAAGNGAQPYSVVIVDLTVPGGMGGNEAIAELRQLDPAIRAIVSSGYSNDPVMANYRDHGFVGRIPKPYEFDEFAKVVCFVMANPTVAAPVTRT